MFNFLRPFLPEQKIHTCANFGESSAVNAFGILNSLCLERKYHHGSITGNHTKAQTTLEQFHKVFGVVAPVITSAPQIGRL